LRSAIQTVDSAPPDFELLVKKTRRTRRTEFLPIPARPTDKYGSGLTSSVVDQCPHGVKFAREIERLPRAEFKPKPRYVVLRSFKEAREPQPVLGFSIIYKGM